jgi:hypothetical protein
MLFFLARSYRYLHQPARLLLYVSLFYITFWAFISNNVYFATSFMGAIMLSLAGGWVLGRLSRKKTLEEQSRRTTLQRLIVISLACFTLVYIFINYTYQPALQFYYIFTSLADRVGLLVLSSQEAATPTSYQWFERAWRSQQAYLVLTGWQWLIALTSLVAWALGLIRLAKLEQKRWLLWLMYSAFGVLLVYGVLADYAGFMSTNLQLRMFTPFALFSSPLAADLVSRGIRALHARWRKLATTIAVAAITFGALALALKVTNDPALGNQWFFYTPTELAPARWINQHEVPQNEVWVDTWRHLPHVYYFWEGETPYVWDQYRWGKPQSEVRYTLISELVLLRANRSGISLPDTNDKNRVYDNGTAQLYHRRPLTPYQR